MMQLNRTRGEYLRMLRKQEGLSLRQAANLVRISFSYLSKIERGKSHLSLDVAHALMNLYGGNLKILGSLPHEKTQNA
jgi:transcriptional regulator with XRE-family HTH domain